MEFKKSTILKFSLMLFVVWIIGGSIYGERKLKCKIEEIKVDDRIYHSCVVVNKFTPCEIDEVSENVQKVRKTIVDISFDGKLTNLKVIPENLADILPDLKRINITNTKLNRLTNLDQFSELEELNVINNSIKAIFKGNVKGIPVVNITDENLVYVEPGSFRNVYQLSVKGNCEMDNFENYCSNPTKYKQIIKKSNDDDIDESEILLILLGFVALILMVLILISWASMILDFVIKKIKMWIEERCANVAVKDVEMGKA